MEVNGNVKIAGGNTSPGNGKVLTSDASGNASWQTLNQPAPKVGFRVYGISSFETAGTPNNEMPYNDYKKVEFQTKSYDTHNAFIITGNSTATSTKSTYTIPVAGVYHFDVVVKPEDNILIDNLDHRVRLQLNRGGAISTIAMVNNSTADPAAESVRLSMDVSLLADDVLSLEFFQVNYLSLSSIDLETSGQLSYWSGHLVFTQ